MPKTLLLADDSVTIQKVVGITFANEDVKLVTVDNGDEAIARAREIKPDLVLADVSMPGLDGYALCAAIKADPDLAHIPVLLLTGTFENFDQARAAEAKVDAHISKPFEAQALVDQVHRLLERETEAPPVEEAAAAAPDPDLQGIPSEAKAPAASDFSFDDLEFEPPAGSPAEATDVLAEGASAAGSGLSTTATPPLTPGAFEELTPVEEGAAPPGTRDGATQLDDAAPIGESLFSEAAVLDTLEAGLTEESAPGLASLEADPFSVDPEEEPDVSGEPAAQEADPLGESDALGDLPAMAEAEPLVSPPDQKTVAWESGKTPLTHPKRESAQDALAFAEPVSAAGDSARAEVAEVLMEEAIDEPEPAALIAEAQPASGHGADVIHEVLEKLAWEAFGPLSEQLVREIVQKVEAIAWEVVPQLAERLIQDEIERMKAHTSE